MRDYTIWTSHGEVGQNVAQENNDDVTIRNPVIRDGFSVTVGRNVTDYNTITNNA
jgi:hypothetical protein